MKNKHFIFFLLCCAPLGMAAQSTLEGYVFEQNNRGFLNQAKVRVFKDGSTEPFSETETDIYGHFSVGVEPGQYHIVASKDIFFDNSADASVAAGQAKIFVKIELKRRPGYLFDATLAEVRESPDQLVDAIQGATIEIYNRTAHKPELVIDRDSTAFFQFTFERGFHYTILLRKEGYLAKRIEVYVNVNGCILCIDGVRDVSPGVTESLTEGNEMGTLLANIELTKAKIDKRIKVENIYYDYDKWDIRPDAAERLDDVVQLLKDNPGVTVELGSHTDSRGNDEYNEALSQKRAQAAVAYIISQGIDSLRITAKGYGEKMLVNRCGNGVDCTEAEHQQNRRTELRITGVAAQTEWKSLEKIIMEEDMDLAAKGKSPKIPSRDRQLPEANNSIKLSPPPLVSHTEPEKEQKPQTETTRPVLRESGEVHILELPDNFRGYAIELTTSTNGELGADNPVFKGQNDIFHLQEKDGTQAYFIVNIGRKDAAQTVLKKKITPAHPNARLVLFGEKGKEYVQ